MDPLTDLKNRLKQCMAETEKEIEDRQRSIATQLKSVQNDRNQLGVERRQLEDERNSIEIQQSDLDTKLAELSSLRMELGVPQTKKGWCCGAKNEKLNELDVTGTLTLARVDAVDAIKVYGGGSEDVNGTYFKVVSGGDVYFRKSDSDKALYYQNGAGFGLPDAWYISDCYRGAGLYFCRSSDERVVPFAGWEIFEDENFGNPGIHPPPLLEVDS
mmetsp:Transcript_14515/g.36800  ORF Transcript_14515/g.36800 Transcript_14515/m.36800 type:complete len:215 (+) Transcript_14515:68-712(+)